MCSNKLFLRLNGKCVFAISVHLHQESGCELSKQPSHIQITKEEEEEAQSRHQKERGVILCRN